MSGVPPKMSSRKFSADKIAKRFTKKLNDADQEKEFSSTSDAEESEIENDLQYNPSSLRAAEKPKISISSGRGYTGEHANFSDQSDSGENSEESAGGENDELEEEKNEYSLDSGSDNANLTSDDEMLANDDEINALEEQLAQAENEEEEKDEAGELVTKVSQQREEDLKIAHGNTALQEQKKRILTLLLKLHPLISLINQLPPSSLDDDAPFSPYVIACEDEEVAAAFKEAAEAVAVVRNDFHKLKATLESFYEWEEDKTTDKMMEIITHWGQKFRQAAGMKSGTVINRPIEQQIVAALRDKETLTQPTRRVTEKRIFGVEEIPEFLHNNYSDEDFYDKLIREIIAEKNPEVLARVKSSKPTKGNLRSKQISFEVIPQLQNYMSATMRPVPDTIDAMLRSLMSN